MTSVVVYLSDHFWLRNGAKSGPDVSGRALSGRITRTALSAKEDLNSLDSMDLSCSVIRDKVAKQKRAREDICALKKDIKYYESCLYCSSLIIILEILIIGIILQYLKEQENVPSCDIPNSQEVPHQNLPNDSNVFITTGGREDTEEIENISPRRGSRKREVVKYN